MKNKETYEVTLTSKLDALPLPNLEEAIWSRIEAQLDIDMPTDDGGGNTPAPNSPLNFGWLGGAGMFCIVAVLVSLFMITQSKDKGPSSTTTTLQEASQRQADSVASESPPLQGPQARRPNSISPSIATNDSNDVITPLDSNTTFNFSFPSLKNDSVQTQISPPVAIVPQKDSVPPKRQRGVRGITDSDYRIVPKKDST